MFAINCIDPKYDILFTPFKIGNVEVKNRYQMCGMGGNDEISAEGACAPNVIDYYVERAKGGIGLISTGTVTILDRPKYASKEVLIGEGVELDTVKRTFGHLADRVHAYGAKMMMQMSLGTTPSQAIDGLFSPTIIVNDFTKEDFKYFVERYRTVSKVMKNAGFDLIEVHAMHTGYIFDQLITASVNHRTDEYGGSVENRLRLAGEVRQAIAEACGPDYPVSVKLSPTTSIYKVDPETKKVTVLRRELEESIEIAKELERLGYDLIDLDGIGHSFPFENPRDSAFEVKSIKDAVSIPVLAAGSMDDPDIAADFLRDGVCDAFGLGRQSFADPAYANKLRANHYDDIRFCLHCNQGCINRNLNELTVKCAINANAGRELSSDFAPLRQKKTVMVVGGGPGGMEVARVAASRGHEVTLYEKSDVLGGDFIAATAFPFRKQGRHLIGWYRRQLESLPVKVELNTEVDADFIGRQNPDVVVLAVGADEFTPPIKGADSPIVIQATDYILNDRKDRQNVVIIGGGMTGCEIALEDARAGKNVTLVEMADKILLDPTLGGMNRIAIKSVMDKEKMTILEKTRLTEVKDNAVILENTDGRLEIPADVVVLAVGFRPRNKLYKELQNYAGEVYNVGNSSKVGNIYDAIWPAYEVGNGI